MRSRPTRTNLSTHTTRRNESDKVITGPEDITLGFGGLLGVVVVVGIIVVDIGELDDLLDAGDMNVDSAFVNLAKGPDLDPASPLIVGPHPFEVLIGVLFLVPFHNRPEGDIATDHERIGPQKINDLHPQIPARYWR